MDFNFEVDNNLKQEFLKTKPTATAESDSFVLRSADEFERLVGKPIYNMTYAELKEMIAMKFRNSSVRSIIKNVSVLKGYIDFCIDKKVVNHMENRLSTFTMKEAKEFVHKQALVSKYITKEQLREYQNILINPQDQLLLELPFIGVRGRTIDGATFEEIINLSMDNVDEENKRIELIRNDGEGRVLEVERSTIELIKDTFNQEVYIENNGELTQNARLTKPRESVINKVEHFVLRVPGKNKSQKFTPQILNARMRRIQNVVDNHYLTYTSLYMSGMLSLAMEIYRDKGELEKNDYIDICDKYFFGTGDPEKYWHSLKTLFRQYLEMIEE